MRKLLSIIAVSFFMMGMTACDVIDEQDYIKNNGGITPPEHPEPDPGETGDFTTSKCVLLEDYTGVRCVNCPKAAVIALGLQEQYGHSVVVLGVHSGFYSTPIGGFPNFKSTEGDEWYSFFGFIENPIGTVNRKLNSGVYGLGFADWADAVATTLQEEATVGMASNVEYDETSRNLKVDISSKALVELPDTYSLTVCIMEDSIVGKQSIEKVNPDDPEVIENYVHRHVFRKTMNGAWGEEINTTAIAPEDVITKSYTTTLDAAYNADNCYIIAYVSNSNTKEVLQVIEKKIK
ncbi:MAG: Omp28 family outer membrane lipoprotein [Bacteroidales bacterium]|nr:Omp28 family outer membrane lipoprotein [Bacteroidales bacterium]